MQRAKIQLRQRLRQKLAVLDSEGRLEASRLMAERILDSEIWQNAKVIGLFAGQKDEMETSLLWTPKKTLVYPRIVDERLIFFKITHLSELQPGPYGLLEPTGDEQLTPDLLLVPGLAFDAQGGRLGRGKGFYDRWLQVHPTVLTSGVCFDFQMVSEIPMEVHDQTVDCVVTEKRLYKPND